MEERKKELTNKLEQIAYQKTNAFCYSCYKTVKQSHCPKCFSDDFMRELEGVGVEYGTNWVIIELLNEALTPVNAEENFTELLEDIYPEQTKVAWLNLNTVQVLKEQDPISWNIALNEHIILSLNSTQKHRSGSHHSELLCRPQQHLHLEHYNLMP